MALPVIRVVQDCADYSRTVSPYIPQLYSLPQQIWESISNPSALQQIYLETNPLITAFAFCLFISPIFLIVSEVNRNYSQVDRCWSFLPTIYNAHYTVYAHLVGLQTKRMDTMIMFSIIWSCRLTFNYWRKGGYSIGSEDYRWEILRKHISPPLFFVFNVFFIALAQSVLLFLITTPSYVLLLTERLRSESDSLTTEDWLFAQGLGLLVFGCFFADEQQWNYQNAKAKYKKTAKLTPGYSAEELDRGFVVSGLWSWSRHPNFAGEQAIWVALYQWACWDTDTLFNWTLAGAIGYLLLFQASTWFTELQTAKKYPEYREYQARVGKFIPRWSMDAKDWKPDADGAAAGDKDERRVTRSMDKK